MKRIILIMAIMIGVGFMTSSTDSSVSQSSVVNMNMGDDAYNYYQYCWDCYLEWQNGCGNDILDRCPFCDGYNIETSYTAPCAPPSSETYWRWHCTENPSQHYGSCNCGVGKNQCVIEQSGVFGYWQCLYCNGFKIWQEFTCD